MKLGDNITRPYRIGWVRRYCRRCPHRGWRALFCGHQKLRRPWQAEAGEGIQYARRALTPNGAQRKVERDAAFFLHGGRDSLAQRWLVFKGRGEH